MGISQVEMIDATKIMKNTPKNRTAALKSLNKPGTWIHMRGPGGKSMSVTKIGKTYYMVESRKVSKPRKK